MYFVNIIGGSQGIIRAKTLDLAYASARTLFGASNVTFVREASEDEVGWHEAMGGIIY